MVKSQRVDLGGNLKNAQRNLGKNAQRVDLGGNLKNVQRVDPELGSTPPERSTAILLLKRGMTGISECLLKY